MGEQGQRLPSFCAYGKSCFCSVLPHEEATLLCSSCRVKRYSAKTVFDEGYFAKGCACILSGLASSGVLAPGTGRYSAQMLCGPGKLIGTKFPNLPSPAKLNEVHTITDVAVGLFDQSTCLTLYRNSIPFLHALLVDYSKGWHALESLGCEPSAKEKVRYFLSVERELKLPLLSQSAIAEACGLSRQSVAKNLVSLAEENPALFPTSM